MQEHQAPSPATTDPDCGTVGWRAWLRLLALTLVVWFGPSVLVLQHARAWVDVAALGWVLPVFPGAVLCAVAGSFLGRLPDAASRALAALVTIGLVASTLVLAHWCRRSSSEWFPLLGAFLLSCLLWWMAHEMVAA